MAACSDKNQAVAAPQQFIFALRKMYVVRSKYVPSFSMCDFLDFGLTFSPLCVSIQVVARLPQSLKSMFFERLKSTFFEIFPLNGRALRGRSRFVRNIL